MPKRIYKKRFDRFVFDPAWQVITSAAYDQKAMDVLQGRPTGDRGLAATPAGEAHSPFALALFDALAGDADFRTGREGDGVITATEVYAYVRDRVEPETLDAGAGQAPDARLLPAAQARQGRVHLPAPEASAEPAADARRAAPTRGCSRSTRPTRRCSTDATAPSASCRRAARRSACWS